MSAGVAVVVGLLGGVGALARLLVDGAISARAATPFPIGILVVNLSGAFLLGVLVGATGDADVQRLIGGGLLGAYTTFSTWMLQTQRLAEQGHRGLAALNLGASLVLGLAAVWFGREIGLAL